MILEVLYGSRRPRAPTGAREGLRLVAGRLSSRLLVLMLGRVSAAPAPRRCSRGAARALGGAAP